MTQETNRRSDRQIVIERNYVASLSGVWHLWANEKRDRIVVGSWRICGEGPLTGLACGWQDALRNEVQFMKRGRCRSPPKQSRPIQRLFPGNGIAYTRLADFIPGLEPCDIGTTVVFTVTGDCVRLSKLSKKLTRFADRPGTRQRHGPSAKQPPRYRPSLRKA